VRGLQDWASARRSLAEGWWALRDANQWVFGVQFWVWTVVVLAGKVVGDVRGGVRGDLLPYVCGVRCARRCLLAVVGVAVLSWNSLQEEWVAGGAGPFRMLARQE
jgi:hypothetical protein